MRVRANEWRDAGRESKLEILETTLQRSPVLYVTTEILVHDLTDVAKEALAQAKAGDTLTRTAPLSTPCWCCGSRTARIVGKPRKDLALYIDRLTGKRVRPEQLTPEQQAIVEAAAEHVKILIRVSVDQLPILLAPPGKHVLVSGSTRAGKTQVCAYVFAREWLLRGGRRANLWLVAPTRTMAYELMQQVIYGDDDAPPVLPAVLFTSIPTSEVKGKAIMVDGSILSLKHLGNKKGTNLKSKSVQAILVDEAATMSSTDQLSSLETRVHKARGSLLLASTPTKRHWLKDIVADPCNAWDRMGAEERADNPTHPGTRWRYASLGMHQNPWVDPVHTWREIQAKGGEDDPAVQQDYLGIWSGTAGAYWDMFSLDANVMENSFRSLQDWDTERRSDITSVVARKLFGTVNPLYKGLRASNHRYIGGMDINKAPHTTLLVQVGCDPADPTNRDKWTLYVWDMMQTFTGGPDGHAERLASKWLAKVTDRGSDGEQHRGIGIIGDGQSINWQGSGGNPTELVKMFGARGFDLRPPVYTDKNHKAANPHIGDSYYLIRELMRTGRLKVHALHCRKLIDSLLAQEAGGKDNTPIKISHTASDRVSSAVDALRYVAWAIYRGGAPTVSLVSGGGMLR